MAGLKIAIASGKGGVGKTTVATGLASVLSRNLSEVQFIDCDVEEPDAALFLKPEIEETAPISINVPNVDTAVCDGCGLCRDACRFDAIQIEAGKAVVDGATCSGCGLCSIVCPTGAITERTMRAGVVEIGLAEEITFYRGVLDVGRGISTSVISSLVAMARGDLPTVVDCGPGMASPVMASMKDCDRCVIVIEPTPAGFHDLGLMLDVARSLGLPAGIVVNKCQPWSPAVEDFVEKWMAPILMRIPFRREFAYCLSRGGTINESDRTWDQKFWRLYQDLGRLTWSDLSK
jgi:MinD superfamily P-loop ATPase